MDPLIVNVALTGMVPTKSDTPYVPLTAEEIATLLAIAAGGSVRTGIEDNVWFDRERTELATNERLVARVAELAALAERRVATPAEARALLGLRRPAGVTR